MKRPLPLDAGSGSAAPPLVASDPSARAAQDDDSEPAGYYVGQCGHRAPLMGPAWHVGPCEDCDAGTPPDPRRPAIEAGSCSRTAVDSTLKINPAADSARTNSDC